MKIEHTERMHRILGVIHHLSIHSSYRKWNRFGRVCEAIIELCIDIDSDKIRMESKKIKRRALRTKGVLLIKN